MHQSTNKELMVGKCKVIEMINKSFIESDFPAKEVSEESVGEKNIRHGHISTLHIWWA